MELGPRELAREWKLEELVEERSSKLEVAVVRSSRLEEVGRWNKLGVAGERWNKLVVEEHWSKLEEVGRWSTPEASTRVRVARESSSGKASLVGVGVVE